MRWSMLCAGAPSTAGFVVVVWWRRKMFDRRVWKFVREVKCRLRRRAPARGEAILEIFLLELLPLVRLWDDGKLRGEILRSREGD